MATVVLIVSTGLSGPAAVFGAMRDPDVHTVELADPSQAPLDAAWRLLGPHPGAAKLRPARLDLADRESPEPRGAGPPFDPLTAELAGFGVRFAWTGD